MENDVVKVKAVPVVTGKGPRTMFQSDNAQDKARAVAERADDEVSSGVIDTKATAVPSAELVDNMNESVLVVARQSISRTRIGNTWYSFAIGKKYLVPRHVSVLLEEKGVI